VYLAGKIGESTLNGALSWRQFRRSLSPLVEFAKDRRIAVSPPTRRNDSALRRREGNFYLSMLAEGKTGSSGGGNQ
jgi:hypothetical protein